MALWAFFGRQGQDYFMIGAAETKSLTKYYSGQLSQQESSILYHKRFVKEKRLMGRRCVPS